MPAQALAPSLHVTADNLPTWQTNGTVWGLASAGGKVFAGGGFTQVRPPGAAEGSASSIARSGLVVLDAATGSPRALVLNVTRGTAAAVVRAVATSPDKGPSTSVGCSKGWAPVTARTSPRSTSRRAR